MDVPTATARGRGVPATDGGEGREVMDVTGTARGNGRGGADGAMQQTDAPHWLSRHDLLRRPNGSGPSDPTASGGIRLRRQRRVFAPFTALPSLAREPFTLRPAHRRRPRP